MVVRFPDMKIFPPIFSLLVLLVCNQHSFADHTETGIDLRDQCNAVNKSVDSLSGLEGLKTMSCIGFVHGVVDTWILAGKQSCVPDQVSYAEEASVVHKASPAPSSHCESLRASPHQRQ
jgi:hypothetical protein